MRKLGLQTDDAELIALIRRKLAMPGNEKIDVSPGRMSELRRRFGPELQPVLRAKDFAEFDVERAFRLVADLAAKAG